MLNIFDYYTMWIKECMLSKRERHIMLFLVIFFFLLIPFKPCFLH